MEVSYPGWRPRLSVVIALLGLIRMILEWYLLTKNQVINRMLLKAKRRKLNQLKQDKFS